MTSNDWNEEELLAEMEQYLDDDDGHEEAEAMLPSTSPRKEPSLDFKDVVARPLPPSLGTLRRDRGELKRDLLSLWSGIGMIVATSVGGGIFATPGIVYGYTESVGSALLIWILAGLLAASGALCYAELGAMMPESGGEFTYLLRAYNDLPPFLFAWTGILLTRPGSIAIITLTFSDYFCRVLSWDAEKGAKWVGILCVLIICALNVFSTTLAIRAQNLLALLKVLSLALISVVGLYWSFSTFSQIPANIWVNSSTHPGNYALAMYSALWAYDGWNSLNIVTGELRDPQKNLPKAVIGGPLIVMVSYVFTNWAYFAVVPPSIVKFSSAIAVDFGRAAFRDAAEYLVPLIVMISCLSAIHASVFSGSRLIWVSAKHGHLPDILSTVNPKWETPIYALILLTLESILYILIGDMKFLINMYSMIALPFYFLSALGVLILRWAEPDAIRPFKVWLGMPVLFSSVTLFLICFGMNEAPLENLAVIGIVLIGTFVWITQIRKFKLSPKGTLAYLSDWIEAIRRRVLRREHSSYRRQVSTEFELNDL